VWPFYLQVGEPTRLTTDSTRMSRVVDEPDQKSTCIEICKKIKIYVPTHFDNFKDIYEIFTLLLFITPKLKIIFIFH